MRIFVYIDKKLCFSSDHLYPYSFEDIFIEVEEKINRKRDEFRLYLIFEDGHRYEIQYPCIRIDEWQWRDDIAIEIKPCFSWSSLWQSLLNYIPRKRQLPQNDV